MAEGIIKKPIKSEIISLSLASYPCVTSSHGGYMYDGQINLSTKVTGTMNKLISVMPMTSNNVNYPIFAPIYDDVRINLWIPQSKSSGTISLLVAYE